LITGRPSLSAISRARAVFPLAVGPSRVMTRGWDAFNKETGVRYGLEGLDGQL
tara:strand:- start:1164 stop:1322 length:159 start_codon:yes stop_codon:yes gene_type:complete